MDISKVISSNLSAWMEADRSLDTIQKLESRSGVGFGTIRRTRNGDGNITVEKLAALAAAFGRHPAELMIEQGHRGAASVSMLYAPTPEAQRPPLMAQEPTLLPRRSPRDERIDAINALLTQMNEYGLVAMLEKAKDVARDYPVEKSKTAS